MKPILLKFAGIRSYRSEATIDFSSLDLFAVIGDTGAGKSTILEALTFALYGRKTWSGGTLDELIADGEKRMRVEFTFVADGDEWTLTRTRNRTATPDVHKLVNSSGSVKIDNAVPVTDKVIELLGLNLEQFTRAVLMPQGRFDELLRASPTDRTRILTSILGLDELKSVRTIAEDQIRGWRDKVVAARTERDLLGSDPQAALRDAEQAATEKAKSHAHLAARAAAATAASDTQHRLDGAASALARELERLPATDRPHLTEELKRLSNLGYDLLDKLGKREVELLAAETALAGIAAAEADVLDGLAGRDAVVETIADLRNTSARLTDLNGKLEALELQIAGLRKSPPPSTVDSTLTGSLQEAQTKADEAKSLASAKGEARQEAEAVWDTVITARTDAQRRDAELRVALEARSAAKKLLEQRHGGETTFKEAFEAAEQAREQAVCAEAAAAAAAHSHPGDDCPVCSRPLPPTFSAPAAPSLNAANSAVHEAKRAHHSSVSDLAVARAELIKAEAELEKAKRSSSEAAEVVGRAEGAAGAAEVDTRAPDREAALAPFVAAADSSTEAMKDADEHASECQGAVTEAQAAVLAVQAAYETSLKHFETNRAELESERSACRHAVDLLPVAWQPQAPLTADTVADAVTRLRGASQRLDEIAERRQRLQNDSTEAGHAMEAIRTEDAESVQQPATAVVTEINRWLERAADVRSAAATSQPLICPLETELPVPPTRIETRVKTANLEQIVEAARTGLDLSQQIEDTSNVLVIEARRRLQTVTDELADTLRSAGHATVAELQAAAGEARQRDESAQHAVLLATAARDRALQLQRILDVGEPFIQNLEVISEAMRESGFIKHLVKSRETELLAEATRRLRAITNGRFGFVADFGVANMASGEIRSPDSLSGGERFQAALALALGLVEIASRGAGRLDAVFVDEGFGSLDSAALDMALATLASVAGGGKTVALISHLRPVAEYVETVLHVTCTDVLGSKIERLDQDARDKLLADDIRSGLTA